jgi:hypothetical protein
VGETDLIPRLVGGDTEIVCGKLKGLKGFLKPNFELEPKLRQAHLYQISKKFFGQII